jgi:3-deoxy-7-phosphoheptulonate synthase
MSIPLDDLRIASTRQLIPPVILMEELPVSPVAETTVAKARDEVAAILSGKDDRVLAIVGPCSIHDPKAALEYADRLAELKDAVAEDVLLIMRVYFEKPRTTVGWKGLINDPHLDNSYDVNTGLRVARGVLRDITDLGLGTGTEYLDPITPQYIGDLVSWGAIGARTTESQVHRQLTSGLSCPVGFKNSTDGSIQVAVDAIKSAAHPHIFLSVTKQGRSAIFSTSGNPDCHVILRGGGGRTNYDSASVQEASRLLAAASLDARVMIDMSHANSEKQHQRQVNVCADICRQVADGEQRIFGVMIESNLVEGNQKIASRDNLVYGQSITDACIGWDDSVACLAELAAASRRRRG